MDTGGGGGEDVQASANGAVPVLQYMVVYLSVVILTLWYAHYSAPLSIRLLAGLKYFTFFKEEAQDDTSKKKKSDSTTLMSMAGVPLQRTVLIDQYQYELFDTCVLLGSLAGISLLLHLAFQISGYIVPVNVAFFIAVLAVVALVRSLATAQFDFLTVSRSEIYTSAALGIAGFFLSLFLLTRVRSSLMDFGIPAGISAQNKLLNSLFTSEERKDSLAAFVLGVVSRAQSIRVILSIAAGLLTWISFPASLRFVRCFHIATTRRQELVEVKQQTARLTQGLLNLIFILPLIATALYIQPLGRDLFVARPAKSLQDLPRTDRGYIEGGAYLDFLEQEDWALERGLQGPAFESLRFLLLLAAGTLRAATLRIGVQAYCNLALVKWHTLRHSQGRVVNEDPIKYKVLMHNMLIAKAALQHLGPALLSCLLLVMSCVNGEKGEGKHLLSPSLIQGGLLYLAWWSNAVWFLFSASMLALFRLGSLGVS